MCCDSPADCKNDGVTTQKSLTLPRGRWAHRKNWRSITIVSLWSNHKAEKATNMEEQCREITFEVCNILRAMHGGWTSRTMAIWLILSVEILLKPGCIPLDDQMHLVWSFNTWYFCKAQGLGNISGSPELYLMWWLFLGESTNWVNSKIQRLLIGALQPLANYDMSLREIAQRKQWPSLPVIVWWPRLGYCIGGMKPSFQATMSNHICVVLDTVLENFVFLQHW